ncbi:MAG: hypothetical protein QOG05_2004 [Streptosporangiaceae bacterium]|jgi:hypothetical protein|nr:hypothetical protein [Streptosporangiaceae bacterium]
MTTRVQPADMQNARARSRAVYHLAAELLALFGIDEHTLLKADATPIPTVTARTARTSPASTRTTSAYRPAESLLANGDGVPLPAPER